MFEPNGEFQKRLNKIVERTDACVKELQEKQSPDKDTLKKHMLKVRIDAHTLLYTIREMSKTLQQIETIEDNLKQQLVDETEGNTGE